MNWTTITVEGNLIPVELIERIAQGEGEGQQPVDFRLEKGHRLSDEIATAWSDARAYWDTFQRGLRRLRETDSATTVTRERWVVPLLEILGYSLTFMAKAAVVDGRTYAISHRAGPDEDSPPVDIEDARRSLDQRPPSGRPRLSPHALVQEYLNSTEQLWGIVTNGLQLRLLRDSSRMSRPAYIEWDLETMFADERFAEFAILYRVLHRTRLPCTIDDAPRCLLERYHHQGIEAGGRVREGLRVGVDAALRRLGNGLLRHPANIALREAVINGRLTNDDFYRQLLRLVYRLLFLMVAEERKLLAGSAGGLRIYNDFYSVGRLRRLAEQPGSGRGQHGDLWLGLLATFQLLQDDDSAGALGMTGLDGDLFGPYAIPAFMETSLRNADLLAAVHALSLYRDSETKTLRRVNYNALDVEELGSVYESLLDYRPAITLDDPVQPFDLISGTERKTTGSYYTRPELVAELIKSALEPVLADRLAAAGTGRTAREQAILGMSVCDPAAGSGHFLLAAARRLGQELACVRTNEEQPNPTEFRRAVRDVIGRCIYGVDLNPLAVDLCKLALWLEGHNARMPLSFLDSHIRRGNALVGARRDLVAAGIPDEAYQPVTGDDRAVAAAFRKRNQQERKANASGQQMFILDGSHDRHLDNVIAASRQLDAAPDATVSAVRAKAEQYECLHARDSGWYDEWTLFNLWTTAFFRPFVNTNDPTIPTTQSLLQFQQDRASVHGQMVGVANELAVEMGFFHWELEFPQVFGNDGRGNFDVVLGNPPWEMMQVEEQQFFASRDKEIAEAPTQAVRHRLIRQLSQTNPPLAKEFAKVVYAQDSVNRFIRGSGRFSLTAVGKLNTYSLFAQHDLELAKGRGRTGIIVPTGIATDDSCKQFFGHLNQYQLLISLFDFENREAIFPAVDSRMKFCLLTMGKTANATKFIFFATNVGDLDDVQRLFTLTPDEIKLLNPNTLTCPIFRTTIDAELTKKIYRRVPVLVNERTGQNPWGLSFRQGLFNMASDSGLFHANPGPDLLPLYEAKLLHQFTHRWATYDGGESRELTPSDLANPACSVRPRYWIEVKEVKERLAGRWRRDWLLGWRDICRATDERTFISSVLPLVACGDTFLLMFPNCEKMGLTSCLLSCLDSLVFDFAARQKVAGTHAKYFTTRQLPILPPIAFSPRDIAYISERVLELVYTAWDMQPFAEDVWSEMSDEQKAKVKCRNAETNAGDPRFAFPNPPAGFDLPPFKWKEECRAKIRAELDARIARLYGLSRDELRYILDPADVYGPDFPGETFRVLKEKEQRLYGEYRTRRLVLEAWDAEEKELS